MAPSRINRALELLQQGHAIYYVGGHSGHALTYEQGKKDAHSWADYINIGMEHGAFDVAGLAEYMRGLVDGGPTRSGHRTPTVIVEAPVNGTDAANVRYNAWQFRQILGRGVHGILLCQAETADAVRAFVEACRYPHQSAGVDPAMPSPIARIGGAKRPGTGSGLGLGTRGRGSESTAAPIWGISAEEYLVRATRGRSTPRASCCLPSSSKARKASPVAKRSSRCRASPRPKWVREIWAWHSAIRLCRANPIRPRCRRRAIGCWPPAAKMGSHFSKLRHLRPSSPRSTRACASSPGSARRPRSSAALIKSAQCRFRRLRYSAASGSRTASAVLSVIAAVWK
jgi:hypothetical protein